MRRTGASLFFVAAAPLLCPAEAGAQARQMTLSQYATACATQMGAIPSFSCFDGTQIPIIQSGRQQTRQVSSCAKPPKLGTEGQCVPFSRVGRLDTGNPDVTTIFICRKYGNEYYTGNDDRFQDIAIVQHNRRTGNTCWFQTKTKQNRNGRNVPSPAANTVQAKKFWLAPADYPNCSGCHDADPFIWTPYIGQVFSLSGTLSPANWNASGPYNPDFLDIFETDQPVRFRPAGKCSQCHRSGARSCRRGWVRDSPSDGWMPTDVTLSEPDYKTALAALESCCKKANDPIELRDPGNDCNFLPPSNRPADLNGDGYDDLIIGVASEDIDSTRDAGAVNVLFGSASGLTPTGDRLSDQLLSEQLLNRSTPPGEPHLVRESAGAFFGLSTASGDFNGDGYADVAVGVPFKWNPQAGASQAGAVDVIYSSPAGADPTRLQVWHQEVANIEGAAEAKDRFGRAVAVGDFNGDGFADLAAAAPGEDIGNIVSAGAVNIIYGSVKGLVAEGDQIWHQDTPGVPGGAEREDFFGDRLATADFNGDGYGDLAIGVPMEDIGSEFSAGGVNVLYGSKTGLTHTGSQIWHQDSPGVEGGAERGDSFGEALATGDFNGDGYADLAVGAPGESVGAVSEAGAVNILYGSTQGLSAVANQIWHQDSAEIDGVAEEGDRFGASLASGDFNGDGYLDLAVGVPDEDIGAIADGGAVNVLYGSKVGLSARNTQIWHQDDTDIEGQVESGDRFGGYLFSADFDGDGKADLAVGVPEEDIGLVTDAGAVNVLYGSTKGLSESDDQIWHQDSPKVDGGAEAGDRFGGLN